MEKITRGFIHFFVYYVGIGKWAENMEKTGIYFMGQKWDIQSYNKICRNFECLLRAHRKGKIHEKSTGAFPFGKALCLSVFCVYQSLK